MSLPERMFLLARTSLFSQGMMKKRNPDAILYYAGYGFAIGLERGISDLSAKEVVYPADDAAELGNFKQRLRQEARRAVGEALRRVDVGLYAYWRLPALTELARAVAVLVNHLGQLARGRQQPHHAPAVARHDPQHGYTTAAMGTTRCSRPLGT